MISWGHSLWGPWHLLSRGDLWCREGRRLCPVSTRVFGTCSQHQMTVLFTGEKALPGSLQQSWVPLDVRAHCQGTLWHCVGLAWHVLLLLCGDNPTCSGLMSKLCPMSLVWEGAGGEAQAGPGEGQRQLQPWGTRKPPARGQAPSPSWPQLSLPPSFPPLPAPPNHKDFG